LLACCCHVIFFSRRARESRGAPSLSLTITMLVLLQGAAVRGPPCAVRRAPAARVAVRPVTVACRPATAFWHRSGVACHAAAAAAAQPAVAARPSSEQCARTLVDISDRGTLSTTTEDAWPMGTHAAYLLDKQGQPLLRLRADAVHTAHLLRDARCSLYVQARRAARRGARAQLHTRAPARAHASRKRFTRAPRSQRFLRPSPYLSCPPLTRARRPARSPSRSRAA
jgi:hypothetical protein